MIAATIARALPVLASAAAPWLLVAVVTWLGWTLQSAGAARQQARTLADLTEANRHEVQQLRRSNAAIRSAEAAAQATATTARAEADAARRRWATIPSSGGGTVCPIDCLLPTP